MYMTVKLSLSQSNQDGVCTSLSHVGGTLAFSELTGPLTVYLTQICVACEPAHSKNANVLWAFRVFTYSPIRSAESLEARAGSLKPARLNTDLFSPTRSCTLILVLPRFTYIPTLTVPNSTVSIGSTYPRITIPIDESSLLFLPLVCICEYLIGLSMMLGTDSSVILAKIAKTSPLRKRGARDHVRKRYKHMKHIGYKHVPRISNLQDRTRCKPRSNASMLYLISRTKVHRNTDLVLGRKKIPQNPDPITLGGTSFMTIGLIENGFGNRLTARTTLRTMRRAHGCI